MAGGEHKTYHSHINAGKPDESSFQDGSSIRTPEPGTSCRALMWGPIGTQTTVIRVHEFHQGVGGDGVVPVAGVVGGSLAADGLRDATIRVDSLAWWR